MSEEKKISFGFSKLIKKPNLVPSAKKVEEKNGIQLIDCLEAQTIKIIGEEEKKEKEPMVIPMPQNRKIENKPKSEELVKTAENATLEELATQELINDSKNVTNSTVQPRVFTITKLTENGEITGEPESTMEDYENVPINEFGLALLRGMGWNEEQGIGKNHKTAQLKLPPVRPKGMGLGADKICKQPTQPQTNSAKNAEELKIIKGAYVRIISGRHKNKFGQILGFDDDAGSVIIKMALDGTVESLQEFLIMPVSKEDYGKDSKVLNLDKYEEYKTKKESKDKVNQERQSRDDIKIKRESSVEIKEIKDSPTYISSDSELESRNSKKVEKNRNRQSPERSRKNDRRREKEDSSPERSNKKDKRREKEDSSPNRSRKSKKDTKRHSVDRSRRNKKDKKRDESDSEDDRRPRKKDEKRYDSEDDRRSRKKDSKRYDSEEDTSKERRVRRKDKIRYESEERKKDRKRYDSEEESRKMDKKRYDSEEDSSKRSRKGKKDKKKYDSESESDERRSKRSHKRSRSRHR